MLGGSCRAALDDYARLGLASAAAAIERARSRVASAAARLAISASRRSKISKASGRPPAITAATKSRAASISSSGIINRPRPRSLDHRPQADWRAGEANAEAFLADPESARSGGALAAGPGQGPCDQMVVNPGPKWGHFPA